MADEPHGKYHPNPDFLPPELVMMVIGMRFAICGGLKNCSSTGIFPASTLTSKGRSTEIHRNEEPRGHDFFQQ